jgi:SAM-dependent methyltransferase
LPNQIADFIVAAQAFHWFEPKATKAEFRRILKPDGWGCLIWNDRRTTGSAFAVAYEALINEFGTDYKQVKHKNVDENRIESFLGPHQVRHFYNFQEFDFEGLLGRLTSSSYAPNVGHSRYEEMRQALKSVFDRYNVSGQVKIEYDTQAFYSKFGGII